MQLSTSEEGSGDDATVTTPSFPSTVEAPSPDMITIILRDPFAGRFRIIDVMKTATMVDLAGRLGTSCVFSNIVTYTAIDDAIPTGTMDEMDQLGAFSELRGPLIVGLPELNFKAHDALFHSSLQCTLTLPDDYDPDADIVHYLCSCYAAMRIGREEEQHCGRRMRLKLHSPLTYGSRPHTLSISTGSRFSAIFDKALNLYGVAGLCDPDTLELREVRTGQLLPRHGPWRVSLEYTPLCHVELYKKGIFGGGKRKSQLDDDSEAFFCDTSPIPTHTLARIGLITVLVFPHRSCFCFPNRRPCEDQ
jgi:hypothetical protein